jgi:chromosome segregation ATPase
MLTLLLQGLTEAMVIDNWCMHWEEGIVKLKSQLTDAMDANKTLSSTTAELTREKNLLTDKLTKVGMEATIKDEELRKMKESYEKALDQLKALNEQMETARANEGL